MAIVVLRVPCDSPRCCLIEKGALSRFIRQRLLYNIWPIEQHALANGLNDIRTDPFAYMYIYGLHIHKVHWDEALIFYLPCLLWCGPLLLVPLMCSWPTFTTLYTARVTIST